jgi:beta-lactamase regulating signal transducer with metallopeptidase domain
MTAAWMVYALLVGALVALAACALEGVCRLAARPSRWVWVGAMTVTIALIALAPQRESRNESLVLPMRINATSASVDAPPQNVVDRLAASLRRARGMVGSAVSYGFVTAARLVPESVARGLALLWVSLSAVAFLVLFSVHGRLRRARRAWPMAELHGTRVRLAPNAGPAVVGFARPEIVVPRWLLERSDSEQRMVIAHEVEHLRARDPLLLTVACAAVALVAWHPAMWWMLSRLRLAVELDCDDRIVRSGIAPRSYGALLIELAGRCSSGMRVGAPALADGSSHLERRLIAMTSHRRKSARGFACALAACSVVLLALACDAELPTSEEVNSMDVAAAEGAAQRLSLIGVNDSLVTFTIDGRKATAQEAHALNPGEIATIEVLKKRIGPSDVSRPESGEIRIITKRAADSLGVAKQSGGGMKRLRVVGLVKTDSGRSKIATGEGASWMLSADTITFNADARGSGKVRRLQPMKRREPFNGVVLLDGVRVDKERLATIPPDEIVSVEVVKGDAARKLFADSAAANGVIRITTRSGAKKH